MHQHKHFRLSKNDFISPLPAVFQGQLDSHFFFSCFYSRASGEDGFIYKALLFLLSRLCILPYNEDKLTTLPSSIVGISFLL